LAGEVREFGEVSGECGAEPRMIPADRALERIDEQSLLIKSIR
jgi:hypothetical protein